jgi:hypothetical protein
LRKSHQYWYIKAREKSLHPPTSRWKRRNWQLVFSVKIRDVWWLLYFLLPYRQACHSICRWIQAPREIHRR